MRFLADQDVYAVTVLFLRTLGHDVLTATQQGLSPAKDEILLQTTQAPNRIFVTRDRDCGNLVFVLAVGTGIIYLRMLPATITLVHEELERVLAQYPEPEMLTSFIVIEPGRHRVRRFGSGGTTTP